MRSRKRSHGARGTKSLLPSESQHPVFLPSSGTLSLSGGTRGLALPLLLFLLLALTLLAHGTLLLAQRDYRASKAFLHANRSREAARSALQAGLERMTPEDSVLPPGSVVPLLNDRLPEELERKADIRWLSRESFFLQGEGRSKGWAGVRRVGALGWRMDPASRLGAFRGGVEVGEGVFFSDSGTLFGGDPLALPMGWDPEGCAEYVPVLDSLFLGREFPPTSFLQERSGESAEGTPGLGLLGTGRLLERSDPESSASSAMVESAPGPGCPGGGEPLLRVVDDPLTLGGGRWCGVLVVSGDLTLRGEGLFQGLILTGGSLRIQGSWRVQGMARVRGSLHLAEMARMDVEACPVFRALAETRRLRTPFLLPGASNLPVF